MFINIYFVNQIRYFSITSYPGVLTRLDGPPFRYYLLSEIWMCQESLLTLFHDYIMSSALPD
jgi:hypothetical protein